MNTYLDASIHNAGYKKWSNDPATDNFGNLTIMAEYADFGPGFNLAGRIAGRVAIEFDEDQVKKYDGPKDVFMDEKGQQPYVQWIDKEYFV
jgi:pectinesterase